jgi:SOS-response transcriptional repressor LexA
MQKSQAKSDARLIPEWAKAISELRRRLNLNQTNFGQRLHSSTMGVSRWERGMQEPSSHIYIELGNLAGASRCWYFWGQAGLRKEDVMSILPESGQPSKLSQSIPIQIAHAGVNRKALESPQLVAIPLLKIAVASPGEQVDSLETLHDAPVENVIAAPRDWCPNPVTTSCLKVRGKSMMPLIDDGYILAVDSSQTDPGKLNGKVVIAWNRDRGLAVSRMQRYDNTDVLQPENNEYKSLILDRKSSWKIVAKVLWWVGQAP